MSYQFHQNNSKRKEICYNKDKATSLLLIIFRNEAVAESIFIIGMRLINNEPLGSQKNIVASVYRIFF